MTLSDVYKTGFEILQNSGIENAAFDNMSIFENCFNLKRQDVSIYRDKLVEEPLIEKFFLCIEERSKGRPLQYILGNWSFMGLNFLVGEGVLIPRDDTEVLVNKALELAGNKKNPKILDLCSGSGAVAVCLANYIKTAKVTAVEISDKAIKYLNKNIDLNKTTNVTIEKLDILSENNIPFCKNEFDLIVSNPPYIKSNDLKNLQREVQFEPKLALDGGEDGLVFYRAILSIWKQFLKNDAFVCVEIGLGQEKEVFKMFEESGFFNIEVLKDINGINRVVSATKK